MDIAVCPLLAMKCAVLSLLFVVVLAGLVNANSKRTAYKAITLAYS